MPNVVTSPAPMVMSRSPSLNSRATNAGGASRSARMSSATWPFCLHSVGDEGGRQHSLLVGSSFRRKYVHEHESSSASLNASPNSHKQTPGTE